MNSITINHLGKRAFDFRVDNGKIYYQWLDYSDQDGFERVPVDGEIKEIKSTEVVKKGFTKVFYD